MRNALFYIVVGAGLLLLGGGLTYRLMTKEARETRQTEATVLLERVREVCKLVTVEGEFSELYNETNHREVTLYLPIPTNWNFSRSAILEVTGKVLVGYDMENVSITVDSTQKRISLSNLPQPEILAIDHEVKYRNLEESFFNGFSADDYTQLNRNAKAALHKKAIQSDLIDRARAQGNEMVDAIRFMAEVIGWEVVVHEAPVSTTPVLPD